MSATPTQDAYAQQGATLQQDAQPHEGGLPMTGLDAPLLLGFAVALAAAGMTMRRLTRP